MPSENYRYFCLDGTGHLHNAEWFYAENDEAAIAHIQAKHPGAKCEIWQEQRLIAKLGFTLTADVVAQSLQTAANSRRLLRETASLLLPPGANDSGDAR